MLSWPRRSHLLAIGLVLSAAGAVAVSGCNQQQTQGGAPEARVADAPAGSSAEEAGAKTGEHHADAKEAAQAHTHTTKLEFSAAPSSIPVGKPATWTLQINDATSGQPIKNFDVVHDKLMHLIVVKNDLTWFNHLHPAHKGNGDFVVTTTLPKEGTYKLYADYTPTGKAQEVPQHEFATGGAQPSPASVLLVPDKMQGPWMTKKVIAHPESEPETKGGAPYEIAMMPMPTPLLAGQDSMLHFQVRDAKGKPIKDLQPYLGALGHCVILSSDTNEYLHSHPMEGGMEGGKHDMSKMGDMKNMKHSAPPKSGGPDVMFHTNFPGPGRYKAWGQFMHKGKIITAAFVVNVGAAKAAAKAGTDAGTDAKAGAAADAHNHDASAPHSH